MNEWMLRGCEGESDLRQYRYSGIGSPCTTLVGLLRDMRDSRWTTRDWSRETRLRRTASGPHRAPSAGRFQKYGETRIIRPPPAATTTHGVDGDTIWKLSHTNFESSPVRKLPVRKNRQMVRKLAKLRSLAQRRHYARFYPRLSGCQKALRPEKASGTRRWGNSWLFNNYC